MLRKENRLIENQLATTQQTVVRSVSIRGSFIAVKQTVKKKKHSSVLAPIDDFWHEGFSLLSGYTHAVTKVL